MQSIVVDSTSVYWGSDDGTVRKIPVGGGAVTTLAANSQTPRRLAIDAAYVYWVSFDGGTVQKVPVNGGTVLTLATGQAGPLGIAAKVLQTST